VVEGVGADDMGEVDEYASCQKSIDIGSGCGSNTEELVGPPNTKIMLSDKRGNLYT
jgi:hypothetical protein